ncbi:MAG: AbrB/MazE/SpoVT family DNA-binding domain-containing protein [Terracidiphilus sp.]|jgi:antitoxin VapB
MDATKTNPNPQSEAASTAGPAPLTKRAKLFKNGRSQAVRLPKEFRFEGTEVTLRRDPATGDVVISPAPSDRSMSFDDWFALYDAVPDSAPEEEYAKLPPPPRNLTTEQMFKIFDRAKFPEDFMADRETSMPRELDLF